MTLKEAIKMLDRIAAQDEDSGRPECVEAEKLGIEALKRLIFERNQGQPIVFFPLPGETKE
jgi:hypothetical protein